MNIEQKQPGPVQLLRLREVKAQVGLSRSSIYALMAQGKFPRPVKISTRAVGWPEHEITAWIKCKLEARYAEEAGLK